MKVCSECKTAEVGRIEELCEACADKILQRSYRVARWRLTNFVEVPEPSQNHWEHDMDEWPECYTGMIEREHDR